MIPYVIALHKVNKRINEQLANRDAVLQINDNHLLNNEMLLDHSKETIDNNERKLLQVQNYLQEISQKTANSIESCMKEIDVIIKNQDKYLTDLEHKYGIAGGV